MKAGGVHCGLRTLSGVAGYQAQLQFRNGSEAVIQRGRCRDRSRTRKARRSLGGPFSSAVGLGYWVVLPARPVMVSEPVEPLAVEPLVEPPVVDGIVVLDPPWAD